MRLSNRGAQTVVVGSAGPWRRAAESAMMFEDGPSGPAGLRRDTPHFYAVVASFLFAPMWAKGLISAWQQAK
jgi:hypothetical protein